MIQKDDRQIQIVCDNCGAEGDVRDDDEFHAMIDLAKADGWSITNPDGRWRHKCATCAKPGAALAAARAKFGIVK